MMMLGIFSFGLVWGWLAGQAAYRMRWLAVLIALAGLVLQGTLIPALAAAPLRSWWIAGSVIGVLLALGWLRALANWRRVRRVG
jgi:hypothetical protein